MKPLIERKLLAGFILALLILLGTVLGSAWSGHRWRSFPAPGIRADSRPDGERRPGGVGRARAGAKGAVLVPDHDDDPPHGGLLEIGAIAWLGWLAWQDSFERARLRKALRETEELNTRVLEIRAIASRCWT